MSPKHVKQMADSEEVMSQVSRLVARRSTSPDIIGIVVNEQRSGTRISRAGRLDDWIPLFDLRIFSPANADMSETESRQLVETLKRETKAARKELVIYISMAFGNPYDEPWGPELVQDTLDWLKDIRV